MFRILKFFLRPLFFLSFSIYCFVSVCLSLRLFVCLSRKNLDETIEKNSTCNNPPPPPPKIKRGQGGGILEKLILLPPLHFLRR